MASAMPFLLFGVQKERTENKATEPISGQTCSSVETKKSEMTGNTFLSLVLFWGHNESAAVLPEHMDFLPSERLLGQNKGREWR